MSNLWQQRKTYNYDKIDEKIREYRIVDVGTILGVDATGMATVTTFDALNGVPVLYEHCEVLNTGFNTNIAGQRCIIITPQTPVVDLYHSRVQTGDTIYQHSSVKCIPLYMGNNLRVGYEGQFSFIAGNAEFQQDEVRIYDSNKEIVAQVTDDQITLGNGDGIVYIDKQGFRFEAQEDPDNDGEPALVVDLQPTGQISITQKDGDDVTCSISIDTSTSSISGVLDKDGDVTFSATGEGDFKITNGNDGLVELADDGTIKLNGDDEAVPLGNALVEELKKNKSRVDGIIKALDDFTGLTSSVAQAPSGTAPDAGLMAALVPLKAALAALKPEEDYSKVVSSVVLQKNKS